MSSTEVILDTETVTVSSDVPVSATDTTYQEQVIQELQVTNALLGNIFGALVFIIIAIVIAFLYRLITHNVTNYI